MSVRYANNLTVVELREELRRLGLSGADCKNELITRLNESISGVIWIGQQSEAQAIEDAGKVGSEGSIQKRPECGQCDCMRSLKYDETSNLGTYIYVKWNWRY
jgi:hypothetical protein